MHKGKEEIITPLSTTTPTTNIPTQNLIENHHKENHTKPRKTSNHDEDVKDDVIESNDQTHHTKLAEEDVCRNGATSKSDRSPKPDHHEEEKENGRERLKRHRVEVAGRVWIPEMWGQEDLLKDWIDCAAFDASLVNSSIMSARAALVREGRRANAARLRVQNGC